VTRYEFLVASVENAGTDCLVWPYKTYGGKYARFRRNNANLTAHVVALEMTTPRPAGKVCSIKGDWVPGDELDAAHGPCHNRLCYNPRHLSWKTRAENIADKKRDGTHTAGESHHASTIPQWKVDGVLAEYKGKQKTGRKTESNTGPTQVELADKYGLSQTHVSRILNGQMRSAA
jgi:hypothetical protein